MRHEIGHCNGWSDDHTGALDPDTGREVVAAEPAKPMAAPVVTMSTYLPPKRFDHEYRGAPLMIIRLDTSEQIRRVCIADWKPGHDVACAIPGWHGGCMIAILEDDVLIARGFSPEHVMRHEIGHCNGWSGHAGAIDPRSE